MRLLPAYRLLILLALSLSLGIGFFFARAIEVLRTDRWDAARLTSENILHVLEQSINRTLTGTDTALLSVARRWIEDLPRLQSTADRQRIRALFDGVLTPDGLSNIWLIDARGQVVIKARKEGGAPSSELLQSLMRRMTLPTHRGLLIGDPVVLGEGGVAILPMARVLHDELGQFNGFVLGAMPVEVFDRLFSSLRLGRHSAMVLARSNGAALLRYEQREMDAGYQRIHAVRNALTDQHLMDDLQRNGHFDATGDDGVERLYGFRRVQSYPLVVLLGQSRGVILAEWQRSVWQMGAYALVLLLACWGLSATLAVELRRRQRIKERLRLAERDLRTIFDNLPSVVSYWDRQLCCRFINGHSQAWYGIDSKDMPGQHARKLLGEEGFAFVEPYMQRALQGIPQLFERSIAFPDGQKRHLYVSYMPDMEGDEVRGIFTQVTDITERKRMEDVLFEEKERMRLTLQAIGDAVLCTDAEGHVIFLNPVAESMLGWSAFDAAGQSVHDVVPLQITEVEVAAALQAEGLQHVMCHALSKRVTCGPVRATVNHRNGMRLFEVEVSASPIVDRHGVLSGGVLVLRNVTETVALAERMTQLAQYDTLTGLPNRLLLHERARHAVAQARNMGKSLAVMYLDLDGFKEINDRFGHDVGDELLVQFSQRLSASVRNSDTVCRLGGDEFILLLAGVSSRDQLQTVAAKAMTLCCAAFPLSVGDVYLGLSAGVALFPEHGESFDVVARHADTAMYAAKRAGRKRVCLYMGPEEEPIALADEPQNPVPGSVTVAPNLDK